MKDLIEKFKSNKETFMVYDGLSWETNSGIGVKPIITPMRKNRDYFKNKQVFDTIIGKAAAMLLVYSGVKTVYGTVMSKTAIAVFETYKIEYSYDVLVDYIQNREKNGLCPLEEAVYNENNLTEAYKKIEKKIEMLMASKM